MTRRIFITPKANQDLDDIFNYLTQNNPDAALRFFDATRQTIAQLAQNPGMGSPYQLNNPRLAGLRKRGVKDFEKYLIFYFSQNDLLSVVRIIHAARDLPTIIEQE
ncbi:MAG TPA: type II toxin-antitoxin system RelE/ParE family toxin [Oculatellaceae cyanobacterium]|jgi:toxin ParE1/3/4